MMPVPHSDPPSAQPPVPAKEQLLVITLKDLRKNAMYRKTVDLAQKRWNPQENRNQTILPRVDRNNYFDDQYCYVTIDRAGNGDCCIKIDEVFFLVPAGTLRNILEEGSTFRTQWQDRWQLDL